MTEIEEIIATCRVMTEDHQPDGWPAVQMKTITALCDEVERLRRDNEHQRERRNAARDAIEKGKAERKAIEQERDQLKAALQRFMELDQNDRDLPLELWAVQHDVSPVDISLALHDAEVLERFKDELVKSVNVVLRPHIEGVCAVVQQQIRQQAKEVQS